MDKMELLYPQSKLADFMLMFMSCISIVLFYYFFMVLFLQNNPMVTFY